MYCKKCGKKLPDGEKFCAVCGTENYVGEGNRKGKDRVELLTFDSYVMYMCECTNDVSLLNMGIQNMVLAAGTVLYDALYEGINNAGYQTGARCVIVFSAGGDEESEHTIQEVIQLAQEKMYRFI